MKRVSSFDKKEKSSSHEKKKSKLKDVLDSDWLDMLSKMPFGTEEEIKKSYSRGEKKKEEKRKVTDISHESQSKRRQTIDEEEGNEGDDDDDDDVGTIVGTILKPLYESEEEEDDADDMEAQIDQAILGQGGGVSKSSGTFKFPDDWARPAAPVLEDGSDLVFQHTETTYTTKGKWGDKTPVIRLYGVTKEENSVLVEVEDFYPYLWCQPTRHMDIGDIRDLKNALNKAIDKKLDSINRNRDRYKHWLARNDGQYVVSIVSEMKESIIDWKPGDPKAQFLKITVSLPQLVPKFRELLEDGDVVGKNGRFNVYNPTIPGGYMCYESKLPYGLRFMVDKRMTGCQWVKIRNVKNAAEHVRVSTCQYELKSKSVDLLPIFMDLPDEDDPIWDDPTYEVVYEDVLGDEGEKKPLIYDATAPVRILSFDIECKGRRGFFPDPKLDPVIQICAYMRVQGETEVNEDGTAVPKQRFGVGFVLGSCDPIDGVTTYSFDREIDLIRAFLDFLRFIDYDISTGYNIDNFDWKYILERAIALGLESELYFTRIINVNAYVKKTTMTSKAYGTKEAYEAAIEGRIAIDMMRYIQREYKLRSYGLNAVSEHFLGDKKMDIHFTQIPILQDGTSADRNKLARYCYKDALLPLRLWDHLMVGFGYAEMSRVTGVPMGILLSRGQTIKIMVLLTRVANLLGFLLPSFLKKDPGETFPGAVVLDPIAGFHTNPISTLDFASLYPSIMIADNLCYSTRTTPELASKHLSPDDYLTVPDNPGVVFVKPHVRKGVMCRIEEVILKRRAAAKNDMEIAKKNGDKARYVILDARQLALKIVANSGYGFTGSQKLPCLDIPRAVTGRGREMLLTTKAAVEGHFTVANGYEFDARVVYGDTDSVMVDFGGVSKERGVQLADEASKLCRNLFRAPHNLENEKTYQPYLLMKKKRYCGLMWVKPKAWKGLPFEEWKFGHYPNDFKKGIFDGYTKVDTKGVETVRRDNARIVGNTMEKCIEHLIIEANPQKAVEHVHKVVGDLMMGNTPLWDLIISEGISKNFEEYEKTGVKRKAVELAKRWQKRDPSTAPRVGDRVPYVVCDFGDIQKTKTRIPQIKNISAGTEDPIYAMENDIPVLVEYYLWNQLMKPLLKLFSPVVAPHEDIDTLLNGKSAKESITGVAVPKRPWDSVAFELLFAPDLPHMKKRRKLVPKAAPLFSHLVVLPKCLGCKTALKTTKEGGDPSTPLCTHCEKEKDYHYGVYEESSKRAKMELDSAYQTCVACLGPGEDIFLCSNKDCWNLYARKKAVIDMEDIAGKFERFTKRDDEMEQEPGPKKPKIMVRRRQPKDKK